MTEQIRLVLYYSSFLLPPFPNVNKTVLAENQSKSLNIHLSTKVIAFSTSIFERNESILFTVVLKKVLDLMYFFLSGIHLHSRKQCLG